MATTLTAEQRRALEELRRHPDGRPEELMIAEGFSAGQLAELVLDGRATSQPKVVYIGGREKVVVLIRITDAGLHSIA
jgi:hypothetical protein